MSNSTRNQTIRIEDSERYFLKTRVISTESIMQSNPSSNQSCVIHGDIIDTLAYLPDAQYDLIVCDPPYNLTKQYSSKKFNSMTSGEYMSWLDTWMPLLKSKLKKNGTMYVCCDWKCSCEIYMTIKKYFTVINRITWARDKGRGSNSNWKNNHEDIYMCVNDKDNYVFNLDNVKIMHKVIATYKDDNGNNKDWFTDDKGNNYRLTCPSNLWDDIVIPFWSMPENTEHPTQKPEKLIAKLILASSNPGDMILDPFAGSGTTMAVATKLGRVGHGIEKEEEYCLIAQKRLELANENKSIQGYDGKCFYDKGLCFLNT